jgi:hypothetical protein
VCSLIPLAAAYFHNASHEGVGFGQTALNLFGRGQAYLLAFSLFGTLLWLAFARADKPRHNMRMFLGLIAVLGMLPIVGSFGVDPTMSEVHDAKFVRISFYTYGFYLLIYHLLLYYMDIPPPAAADIFKREADDMRDKFRSMSNE